ncbi:zinc knuckle CX2CX4HX4C containing protein [Tanacetum coccineum]
MERGFLSRSSMNKKDNGEDKTKKGSVFSDLASKITIIDGKMIGKDGKPLRAVRRVVFQEPISVAEVRSMTSLPSKVLNTPANPVGFGYKSGTIVAWTVYNDAGLSLMAMRLPKPNSKVHWQPKKSVDSKGGSNTTSPSGTTKESDKGVKVSSPSRANQNMTTPLSNSFDVLNTAEKEDVQNPKVSDHAGTSSSNLHVNKDQEESLWSRFNKGKENAKSKSSELEDESDDDEVYMPHGGGFTDGMEDDLECYDGYGTHVYDLTPQEQAFCDQYDIRLNSRGKKGWERCLLLGNIDALRAHMQRSQSAVAELLQNKTTRVAINPSSAIGVAAIKDTTAVKDTTNLETDYFGLVDGDVAKPKQTKTTTNFQWLKANFQNDVAFGECNLYPIVDEITKLFGVSLNTPKDIDVFTRDIESSKYEVWWELTHEKRDEFMDTIMELCNTIVAEVPNDKSSAPIHESPIVQSVDIHTKSTSYAGATGVGLEAVLEGGPWMIRKSLIILKNWSMDTRLLKEELTHIPKWVKLHDVPLQIFEEDGISLIATFIGKRVMLDSWKLAVKLLEVKVFV